MVKSITISIVTYNNEGDILACLKSVMSQTYKDFNLVIIDNASQDRTCQVAREAMPEARIIQLASNKGFGTAHNLAIRTTATPWVLVLNPDTKLEKDFLEKIMSATDREEVGVIGACLLRNENTEVPMVDSAGLKKTFYNQVYDIGSSGPLTNDHKKSREVWGVSGACALYRRAALESVAYNHQRGGEYFDEHFFIYKEDVDLSARLRRKGWRAWYQADAIAYHDRTGRAEESFASTVKGRKSRKEYIKVQSYRNHWLYLAKNAAPLELIPSLFYEFAKFVYLLIFETRTLKGLFGALRYLPIMIKRRYV